MGKTNTNVCKRKGERTHVRDTGALQTPLGGGRTGPAGGVGHPPPHHPAGGQPPSGGPRLDGGHRPDFFDAAGGEANHNVYTPTVTRRAYGVACMRQRLDTLFGGDLAAAVRALVSECGATPGQLAQAAAVIEAKRAEAEEYDSYDVFF